MIDIGSGRLWTREEGNGPALIFLHGFLLVEASAECLIHYIQSYN